MRFAYRHGPSQGRHPTDTLVRPVTEHIPRVALAGKLGWCQMHESADVQATRRATWTNPISGDRVPVVVCDRCMRLESVTAR